MRGLLKSFLILSGVWVICLSCQRDEVTKVPDLPYHFVEFVRYSETCQGDSTRCAVFKAQYPSYDSAESTVRDRINQSILTNLLQTLSDSESNQSASLQAIAEEFFQDYREFAVGGFAMPWELACHSKILYANDKLFSVAMDSYRFMGGAHPNSYRAIFNFDLQNGTLLQIEDIVLDLKAFRQAAEQAFRIVQGIEETVSFQQAGFFMREFQASTQFALTEKGLLLYYNTYEIAPYAAGPTEVLIPYEELQGILNPIYYPKVS